MAVVFGKQVGFTQHFGDGREKARGDGKIEKFVVLTGMFFIGVGNLLLEALEGVGVAEIAFHVIDALEEPGPQFGGDRQWSVLGNFIGEFLAKRFGGEIVGGEANDGELLRQDVISGQIAEGGDELAFGEIATSAEDDHNARRSSSIDFRMMIHRLGSCLCARWRRWRPAALMHVYFFSKWPPNWKRMADKTLEAKSASPRDVKRA